jgi:CD109 antigen
MGGFSVAMERYLLVRPEGFEELESRNGVFDLSSTTPSPAQTSSIPTLGFVDGSRGRSVSRRRHDGAFNGGSWCLLRVPSGCGEQNMISLAPNVYVGKYLLAMGRLRPDIRQTITRNLIVGYG